MKKDFNTSENRSKLRAYLEQRTANNGFVTAKEIKAMTFLNPRQIRILVEYIRDHVHLLGTKGETLWICSGNYGYAIRPISHNLAVEWHTRHSKQAESMAKTCQIFLNQRQNN